MFHPTYESAPKPLLKTMHRGEDQIISALVLLSTLDSKDILPHLEFQDFHQASILLS